MDVEINLRIPRVKTPVKDQNGYPIDNGSVRYLRRIVVPVLPKPGALLQLETRARVELECEVTNAAWNEGKQMFIVYVRYSKRSISAEEYHALVEDPDWDMRPLLWGWSVRLEPTHLLQ